MSMERDSLLREVDEELRREQFQRLWEQYGTYMLAGAVALLLSVGGYKWWEGRNAAAAEQAGSQFEQALDAATAGNEAEAQKLLRTIGSSSTGYASLAQLALAGQALKSGNTEAASAAYEAAAKQASDDLIRDYARLQSISLKIDTADFTEVQNRLNDLIGDKSPWRYMARELLGVAAIKAGKLDDARNVLAPLSVDPRASAAVRERAGALMSVVIAAELARSAPGKVELEKTADANGADAGGGTAAPAAPPAKEAAPPAKAGPAAKGPAAKSK